jgi:hypothetical protein
VPVPAPVRVGQVSQIGPSAGHGQQGDWDSVRFVEVELAGPAPGSEVGAHVEAVAHSARWAAAFGAAR